MGNNSYQSLGSMSFGEGSASGGKAPKQVDKKMLMTAGRAVAAVAVIALLVFVGVRFFGGAKAEKVAEEYMKLASRGELTESYCKKHYPEEAVEELAEKMEELGLEQEDAKLKVEVVETKWVKESELAEYEEELGGLLDDAQIKSGAWVELEVSIKEKKGYSDTQNISLLVLECSGKTGVWGYQIGNGWKIYYWETYE